jgi:hypothetical protein
MEGRTYKIIEIVGTSEKGIEDAVANAVHEAQRTLKGLAWFEVREVRGGIKDGDITEFQVVTRIGFRLLE